MVGKLISKASGGAEWGDRAGIWADRGVADRVRATCPEGSTPIPRRDSWADRDSLCGRGDCWERVDRGEGAASLYDPVDSSAETSDPVSSHGPRMEQEPVSAVRIIWDRGEIGAPTN